MSDENLDLEAGSGFLPDFERFDKPPTIIELDSSDSQDFSETNDTAEIQQYEAPVSFHPADHEPNNSGYKAKILSPQRSGTPKMESSKSDHEVKKDESIGRGKDDVDRRRSDRWDLSSGANEERRDKAVFSPRDGRNSSSYRGRHEEVPFPRRHRSPKETTISNLVATREPGMSRDSESKGRCEMWGSAVNSSESKRGVDQRPGRSSGSPPPPDMDDRRHRVSRSISPRGDRGTLCRNRSRSRSKSRSRSRSHSPYGSRHSERKPPAGQVCRDFLAGRCRRGLHCRFSHQDSTSYSRYSSPLEYPKERGGEKDRDLERERDKDREREIGRDRERYPSRNDRETLYDSRGQAEYARERQSSQGYKSNYEPPYNSNSNRSSDRCLDFSKGRCTRGVNCRYVHHEASSGHGGWGMRDAETERGWDERERDGGSRIRVDIFDDRENDISLEGERDKRAKGKETCKFFLEGRCGRGQGCRFSHEVGHDVHGKNASEQSWSNKMRDEMHSGGRALNAYAVQLQAPNLSFTGQVQVPQKPLLSFYPANQNPVNPNPVNQSLVNTNPITGGDTATVLGSGLGQPTVNSYTSVSSNPNYNIQTYNSQGQTMGVPDNITQSILGPNPGQSFPPAPPPPVNEPNLHPSNMLTSEQAANIDVKAYLSQILANNPVGSTSIPSIPAPAQPGNNPAPHESPVTPPVEIKCQEVKKKEDGLAHKPRTTLTPNPKLSKETKVVKLFKCALAEVVKDLLKPSWKEGQLSREAHKTIVKKVVDKVTGTMEEGTMPQTQEKIYSYLSHSKSKLNKLVQAYVGKYVKPVGN